MNNIIIQTNVRFSKIMTYIAIFLIAMIFLFIFPINNVSASSGIDKSNSKFSYTNSFKNSSINITSSENAFGITTAKELKEWLNMVDDNSFAYSNAYLLNDISDWEKEYGSTQTVLAIGRTLDGNGYNITAFSNYTVEVKGNASFGLLVDKNYGTIRNLVFSTGNDIGAKDDLANGFCLAEKDKYFVMGGMVGINYGSIENCIVNINHIIKLSTIKSFANSTYTLGALGAVVGANETDYSGVGTLSNITVNLNEKGGLVLCVWSKGKTGYGKLGGIVGIANSYDTNIDSLLNICLNFNGGIMTGAVNSNAQTNSTIQIAGIANRGIISTKATEWNGGNSPSASGIIVNGTPIFIELDTAIDSKRYNYLVRTAKTEQLKFCYLSEAFINCKEMFDLNSNLNCYTIPNSYSADFITNSNKVQLSYSKTEVDRVNNINRIIYSVEGEETYNQQVNQIESEIKRVEIPKMQAAFFNCEMDIVLKNVVTPKIYVNGKLTNNKNTEANVYNTAICLVGAENTITVNGIDFPNNVIQEICVADNYIFSSSNSLYYINGELMVEFAVEVGAKIIDIDARIKLMQNTDGATVVNNKLILNKRLNSVKMIATSNKYGIAIKEILGADNANIESTNSVYKADIMLDNSVTALIIEEVLYTVKAEVFATEGGSASVSNTTPVIGDMVTFTAVPFDDYIFLGWTDDSGKYLSFDLVYTIYIGGNGKTLTANFAKSYNVVVKNGSNIVAKLTLDAEILRNYEILSVDTAKYYFGTGLEDLSPSSVYNVLIGWKVVEKEKGYFELTTIYEDSMVMVSVSIDGVNKDFPINASIELKAGDYTVNGVGITVNEVTTLKALVGLTIVSDGTETNDCSATGYYDESFGVLQINAVYIGRETMRVVLINSETGELIANAQFKGKVIETANGVSIIQAIVELPTYVIGNIQKVEAQIYAGIKQLGSFTVRDR